MSDFTTLDDWPHWDTLTPAFRNAFAAIKQEVYDAAGEVWPRAVKLAHSHSLDESDARDVLLKAIVSVSKVGGEEIKNLPSYVLKTYTRLIWKAVDDQKHYESLDLINQEIAADADAAAVLERQVLLGELVARMDVDMLRIYEGLILGYSFEELARKHGEKANVLRSRFSRGLHRLAKEIHPHQ